MPGAWVLPAMRDSVSPGLDGVLGRSTGRRGRAADDGRRPRHRRGCLGPRLRLRLGPGAAGRRGGRLRRGRQGRGDGRRGCLHRLGGGRRNCGRRRHGGRRHRRLRCRWRIEQQRVLAHQATAGPGQLEDDVDEGFLNGAIAVDAQHAAAIAGVHLHMGAGQHAVVLDTIAAIELGRRDADLQRAGLFGAQAGDVDLGLQGLAQRGLDGQAAQAQSPGRRDADRAEGQYGRCRDMTQGEASQRPVFVFQGIPQSNKAGTNRCPPVLTIMFSALAVTTMLPSSVCVQSGPGSGNHNSIKHIRSNPHEKRE